MLAALLAALPGLVTALTAGGAITTGSIVSAINWGPVVAAAIGAAPTDIKLLSDFGPLLQSILSKFVPAGLAAPASNVVLDLFKQITTQTGQAVSNGASPAQIHALAHTTISRWLAANGDEAIREQPDTMGQNAG